GPLASGALESVEIFAGIFLGPEMRRLRLHHRRIQQIAVHADVKQFRLGALLRLAHADFFQSDALADRAVRVVEVAGKNRLGGTDHFAGRLVAHVHARSIEVALGGGVALRIDVERIVRAGLHARLAADAALVVEIDDAVGAAKERHRRADFDARRVVAVIAAQHREVPPRVRVAALLDVFDPRAIHADGDVVLLLAGQRAGMTADAAVLVDDKPVAHYRPF